MNSCERRLRRWLMDSIWVKLSATHVAAPVVSHRLSTRIVTPEWQSHSRGASGARAIMSCAADLIQALGIIVFQNIAVSDIVARAHTQHSIKDRGV